MKNLKIKEKMKNGKVLIIAILASTIIFSSCNKNEDVIPAVEPQPGMLDISALLEKMSNDSTYLEQIVDGDLKSGKKWKKPPTFFNLTYALAKTKLISTVLTNELTVFAPSDEAFNKLFKALGVKNIYALSAEQLKPILLYHVVSGIVKSTDLKNGFVPTLNGSAVKINLDKGVMVNNANVFIADLRALNGIIHVIDEVLLPPSKNLVEVAQSIPDFSILVAAVIKADLVKTLVTGKSFTVFAPTNNAFVSLLNEKGFPSLDAIPVDLLKNVLLYHVVIGRVYSSDLPAGPLKVTPVYNAFTFSIDASSLKITDANGRTAGLVPTLLDVQATNGVIHVIDKVILPKL